MDWEEFYQNIQLSEEEHISDPGRHLFGIILHDSLACLNNFMGCSKLMANSPSTSQKLKSWFSKWDPIVSTWVDKLSSLWKHDEKNALSHHIWVENIGKIGKVIFDTDVILVELKAFDNLIEGEEKDIIDTATENIMSLDTIKFNINSQEYLSLWNRTHLKTN